MHHVPFIMHIMLMDLAKLCKTQLRNRINRKENAKFRHAWQFNFFRCISHLFPSFNSFVSFFNNFFIFILDIGSLTLLLCETKHNMNKWETQKREREYDYTFVLYTTFFSSDDPLHTKTLILLGNELSWNQGQNNPLVPCTAICNPVQREKRQCKTFRLCLEVE